MKMAILPGALAASLALAACTGIIGGSDEVIPSGPTDPIDQAVASLETSRFPRLSHLQWENTIRDLFHLSAPTGLSSSFSGDPLGGVFDNNEQVLLVSPKHWSGYQTAAEEVALMVTRDASLLSAIMPSDLPSDSGEAAESFIRHFGARAYRRPLSEDEVASYLALFAKADALFPEGADAFVDGVRLSLEAFLQSPHFLYRVQASTTVASDGLIHLSGWEIATKLSYMLWNTMPDEKLFAAAKSGALDEPEGIMAEAERMIEDDRARAMVAAFHAQLYQYDHYEDLYKDEAYFPGFTSQHGEDMKKEAELFIDDIVFSGGGLAEILTQPSTFVNDRLAALYGLEGAFGADFEPVALDPSERAGLLTRLGFLASNATPREQNTIHRGVFVNHRILCADLPSPPDNVDGLPPASDYPTNRERVESHTGPGTCGAACHATLINPPGYALEHYNAVGAFQETENDSPVNAASEYRLDGEIVSFDGAIELSALLAESDTAHRCYAEHWLQFAYGRLPQEGDELALDEIGALSKTSSVKALLLALTQTKAFRTRGVEEVAP